MIFWSVYSPETDKKPDQKKTMPTATKIGKKWRARAHVDGAQVSAGNWPTKADALRAALEMEQRGLHSSSSKRVRDVLDRYSAEVSPAKRGARWEQVRLTYFGREDWAALPVDRLTPEHLAKYRDKRIAAGIAPGTVTRDFNLLSDVFNVARKEWRWIGANPLTDVRRPREAPPRTRRLIDGELDRLRIASGYRPDQPPITATARVIAAAEFAIETAMRAGEIVELRWTDVHAKHVHIRQSKSGQPRDVPLSARAREIIEQLRGMDKVSVFTLASPQRDALFRKLCKRALIEGLHFHDLRREATSRLAKMYDVLLLAKITGHRDIKLLAAVYYAPTIADLTAPMDSREASIR